ncbi:MAG TPA: putative lipid II flippase FtsW [Thermoleophilaceae bacterium]
MAATRKTERRPRSRAAARPKPPLEYSILYTATLCLLAAGAVMVYSASSAESLLTGPGDPAYYLKRYLILAVIGVAVLHALSRHGLDVMRKATPLLLGASFLLTLAVMVPGVGVNVNGATRWLGAGPLQFQPSELLKVSLVLYAAQVLTTQPRRMRSLKELANPLLLVVGAACLLLLKQPDMGTALVVCFSIGALLISAGVPVRHLLTILGVLVFFATIFAIVEPYRRARLMSFVNPWHDATGAGFQSVQSMIAIGSGGMFGRGLGESVQKIFYLPEAHTDMILAIIGEELGLIGISAVAALYGLIAYAGLRAAKLAKDRYSKLVAAGLTSLVLSQATLNFMAVLGLAPLTGVPLPFISYGNSNLIVMLAGMGVLLNVARTGGSGRATSRPRPLRAIDGGARGSGDDRGGRNGRPRRAGAGDRRRATG